MKLLTLCILLLITSNTFGQISISVKDDLRCDCKTYTVINSSKDSIYFILGNYIILQDDSCEISDVLFIEDSTTKKAIIDITQSVIITAEKEHWFYLKPSWSIDYHIKFFKKPDYTTYIKAIVKVIDIKSAPKKINDKYIGKLKGAEYRFFLL